VGGRKGAYAAHVLHRLTRHDRPAVYLPSRKPGRLVTVSSDAVSGTTCLAVAAFLTPARQGYLHLLRRHNMSKASRSWPAQFLRSLPPPVFCMPMCGAWFVQTPGCILTRRRAPVCFTFRRTLLDGRPLLCRRAYAVWMWVQTRLRRPPGQPPPPIGPVQAPVPVPQPVVPIPLALPAAPAGAAALAVAGAPPAALVAPPS
jgi:hypothetical protein